MPSAHTPTRRSSGSTESTRDPFKDPPRRPVDIRPTRRDSGGPRSAPPTHKNMLDAVQDVVTVSTPTGTGRAKPSRSATSGPGTSSPPTSRPRHQRAYSTDSAEPKTTRTAVMVGKPSKKKSNHVDVIDHLDFTGIGGGMFHHDGPFDACAPSRNRVATKAPIKAFNEDEADAIAKSRDQRLSPLAQATLSAMNSADSPYSAASGSPYPALNGPTLSHQYTAADRAKSPMKSALQEAWGRADPEPFEEFSAGGYSGAPSANNSIKDGVEGNGRAGAPRAIRRPSRSVPPPQPINLPGGNTPTLEYSNFNLNSPPSSPPTTRPNNGPKRTRSLIGRFRKMRDHPNVPVDRAGSSEESAAENPYGYRPDTGPVPSRSGDDGFVIVDGRPTPPEKPTAPPITTTHHASRTTHSPSACRGQNEKALPYTPGGASSAERGWGSGVEDYFGRPPPPNVNFGSPPSTLRTAEGGLGRKTSLYRKVRDFGSKVGNK